MIESEYSESVEISEGREISDIKNFSKNFMNFFGENTIICCIDISQKHLTCR